MGFSQNQIRIHQGNCKKADVDLLSVYEYILRVDYDFIQL